jgi:hypothetical protein
MKKSTAKTKVSPAPATKPVPAPAAKAPAKAPAKRKSPPAKPAPAAAPVPAAKPAPARPPAAVSPAPVPAAARRPVVTTITARINIGFGNTLHLRGEGPGLSWDRGVPMECIAADLWRFNLGESARGFAFKVLVNDLIWNSGPDYTVASGGVVNITPTFP